MEFHEFMLFVYGALFGWLISFRGVIELRKKLAAEKLFNKRLAEYLETMNSITK